MILEEIMYTDPTTINVNSYSGYEVLNIAPNSPISAAQFSITQYAAAVTMSMAVGPSHRAASPAPAPRAAGTPAPS